MSRGFTLIELLVVLVLISLVSAFVAPRITAPIGGLQLKTASKKIAGAMRYSRSLAVSERKSRVCFFDFENQRMAVYAEPPAASGDVKAMPADVPAEIRYDIPSGVTLAKAVSGDQDVDDGLFQMIFYANGSASGGEIFLSNERGRFYRIRVDFITGMVAVAASDAAG